MKLTTFVIFVIILFSTQQSFAQVSEKHDSKYAQFYRAEALFEKHKYSAAQAEYAAFLTTISDVNDPFYVKAKYYHAISALHLYHPTAEKLLLDFIQEYPETVYKTSIYFQLGNHYYQRRRYKETIAWLTKIDRLDLKMHEMPEYYFNLGYAYFTENQLKQARNSFYEILNMESSYQSPALYYYSHISYLEKNYQAALEGFNKLKQDPSFQEIVSYYITQIYYLQGKYEQVTLLASEVGKNKNEKQNTEMAKMVGDSYYRLGKYDEAVPFLAMYNNKSATTRDEDYQLGYAYFKSGNFQNAIPLFDKVTGPEDELSQVSFYHIAVCYLKQEAYVASRDAFDRAAQLNYDKEIEEDALYNFALLSYKIDYNPFNEAVTAMNAYLKKYPNSKHQQEMYQYLINVYSTMKNYQAAIDFMDKIQNKNIQIKSAYQMMAYNYGVELFQSGKYALAIREFERVKKYPIDNQMNARSLYWIAESYYKTERYKESISAYRSFLEEPGGYNLPMHNAAYYNIGYAYYMEEAYEDAIQSFRTFTLDNNETNKIKLADAYLRIGDSYFKTAQDDEAIAYYQKAVDQNAGQVDYAKFQMGKSLGFKQNYDQKAKIMLDLVQNNPSSTFAVPALYEVAESYRLMDDAHNDKAIQYYNQLIKDYPKHNLVKDAIFQIGILDFKNKRYKQAETRFLTILRNYNDEMKQKEALAGLKDVYSALSQPEKYIALANQYNITLDDTEKDDLFFNSAYDLYQDENWSQAITSFKTYLGQFTKPNHALEAHFLVAKCELKLNNEIGAEAAYMKVLTFGSNRYTEEAALFVAERMYAAQNYQKAVEYYTQLLGVATFPKNELIADIGLMRSYTFLMDFVAAKPHAQKVMVNENALDFVKTEANYVLAKASIEALDYTSAKPYLDYVVANSNAEIAAESQYYLAYKLHLEEDYKGSETAVRKLIKQNGGYSYWVAKALILQAKNSIGLNDLVQAEYTLNSIIKGYTVTDDGILAEANEVMQVLTALKNKDKNINPDTENTIEINTDNQNGN
ncbi:MAG: tetratricopeptide repeat protein [Putridiphycobacter sp.]|nr:tetratricopeptide repeat protein [Putridiphycobacter sp.]